MTGTVCRGIYSLRRILITAALFGGVPAFAGADVKTTYDISAYAAHARTEYKKAPMDLDARFTEKLWETFATKLKTLANVNDIQIGEVTTTKTDLGNYVDYVDVKRSFPAFVQLSLPKPVTLLMTVDETHRECKNPKVVQSSYDEYGSGSSGCVLSSTLEIKGPISVYGTFETESNLNLSDMMRDKQRITVNVSRSYDKADLTIDSALIVDSILFEKNLLRFFDVYNVAGISKKAEDLTRQGIFLGAARVIRQTNERMLDL